MLTSSILTGCKGNKEKDDNKSSEQSSQQSQQSESTKIEKEPIEITMWTFKVAYVQGFQAVADQLEKDTGIKVKIESFTPDDVYRQKVTAVANAGGMPDIVHWWAGTGSNGDSFLELSTKLDESFRNTFYRGAWDPIMVTEQKVKDFQDNQDATEFDKALKAGEYYGVPLDVGGFYTFFGNKKILEEAGLKAEAPKTWEDFVIMMKTVKEKTGKAGLVFGAKNGNVWSSWCANAMDIMYNGEDSYKALLNREEKMSDPKHIKVIQKIEELVKEDLLIPGILNMDIDVADQQFAAGNAAFDLGGSFTMSTLTAMGMKGEDIFAFSVPPISGSIYSEWTSNPFTLTQLSVSSEADAEHQDAALQYVKYLSSKDGAILFSNNAYTVSAIDLGNDTAKLSPDMLYMTKSFVSGETPYSKISSAEQSYFWTHAEWRAFETTIQKIIGGNATAEDAARDFDITMEKEIKAAE